MGIEFGRTETPTGLVITDPIEQRQLQVRTPAPVSPASIDTDQFCFPVDTACTIDTESLTFNQRYSVHVHDENGQSIRSLEVGDTCTLDGSLRFVGLGGPIKLYCRIAAPAQIEAGIDSIRLSFADVSRVAIGARSLHEQPAGTIQTPDDPETMMRAVSALSSALKTTSVERSWPTLRGHPPLLERGDELEIPELVSPTETGVTITVPATHRELYTVAPLSFYLGARIEAGSSPRLEADGFEYAFDATALEDDVARTLRQLVFLDSLVRTEGLYRDELHERVALESTLPFDLGALYGAPLSEQLATYLQVPYDVLEPHLPRWPLTAYVPGEPDGVEILPYVVNELGIVRAPRGTTIEPSADRTAESGLTRSVRSPRSPDPTAGSTDRSSDLRVVEPAVVDGSIEHAWFGPDVPHNASKALVESFHNQLSRSARSETIEILVVCNDARMLEEHDVLGETYGSREALPFNVDSKFGVSRAELATLLRDGGYDFLHFIGHATPDGLRCSDGELDVRELATIDLGVFFLNACQSYQQGVALARKGAFGGIVTLEDIDNSEAVESGETIARLLNLGFPLRAVLELSQETAALGEEYLIVGDGSTDIAQSDGGAPIVVRLGTDSSEPIRFQTYTTKELQIGTASAPMVEAITQKYLTPGEIRNSELEPADLESYLTWTRTPLLIDGSFLWNDGLGAVEIPPAVWT
ncbi:hypothetical protein OB905_05565 [Halobacteria archaeon AArc-dxtr1]|nr:hypothetical protein [Halobacteria archaeon AArc-dxtr1]